MIEGMATSVINQSVDRSCCGLMQTRFLPVQVLRTGREWGHTRLLKQDSSVLT